MCIGGHRNININPTYLEVPRPPLIEHPPGHHSHLCCHHVQLEERGDDSQIQYFGVLLNVIDSMFRIYCLESYRMGNVINL